MKIGDRVRHQEYGEGTVIGITGGDNYGVEYDRNVGGHACGGQGIPRGKQGHCWWCRENKLTLIKSDEEGRKQLYASELMELVRKSPKEYEGKRYRVVASAVKCPQGKEYEIVSFNRSGQMIIPELDNWAYINHFTQLEPIEPTPEPVPFMEAVKNLQLNGKPIFSETPDGMIREYPLHNSGCLRNKYGNSVSLYELTDGKWYLSDPKGGYQ